MDVTYKSTVRFPQAPNSPERTRAHQQGYMEPMLYHQVPYNLAASQIGPITQRIPQPPPFLIDPHQVHIDPHRPGAYAYAIQRYQMPTLQPVHSPEYAYTTAYPGPTALEPPQMNRNFVLVQQPYSHSIPLLGSSVNPASFHDQRQSPTSPLENISTLNHSQGQNGSKCTQCGRFVLRDMARHMRIHERVSRFRCLYPRTSCTHKTGLFNRQYDFKKHLIHCHFELTDPKVRKLNSLSEKLDARGRCPCGKEMTVKEYLDDHIMAKDETGHYKCGHLRAHW